MVAANIREIDGLLFRQLGCGTSIPTCFLLNELFSQKRVGKAQSPRIIALQDYNLEGI